MRTGPNEVVTNDPKAIDLLYGIGSKFSKVGLASAVDIEDP